VGTKPGTEFMDEQVLVSLGHCGKHFCKLAEELQANLTENDDEAPLDLREVPRAQLEGPLGAVFSANVLATREELFRRLATGGDFWTPFADAHREGDATPVLAVDTAPPIFRERVAKVYEQFSKDHEMQASQLRRAARLSINPGRVRLADEIREEIKELVHTVGHMAPDIAKLHSRSDLDVYHFFKPMYEIAQASVRYDKSIPAR
jgi:hypothetical protein